MKYVDPQKKIIVLLVTMSIDACFVLQMDKESEANAKEPMVADPEGGGKVQDEEAGPKKCLFGVSKCYCGAFLSHECM